MLKLAQKVPGRKGEGRTQSVVTHRSNPAMRHFTAVLDPPAPLSHRHTCLDVLASIDFQHLQRSCTRRSLDWCPTVLDMGQEPQSQDSKRWTQTAGLQVNTAWYGLLGFYLPAKLCFILSCFVPHAAIFVHWRGTSCAISPVPF